MSRLLQEGEKVHTDSLRRRVTVVAGLLAVGLSLGAAAPVAAANNTVLYIDMGSCLFEGSGAPNNKTVKIEWRAADGTLKALESVKSDYEGYWVNNCNDDSVFIEPGDAIKTTIGTSARTFTVPTLTVRVDRDTDVVSGKTSPNAGLDLEVTTNDDGFGGSSEHTRQVTSASNGSYTTSFASGTGATDIKGWDYVDAQWTDTRGDSVRNRAVAPGVDVTIRSAFVTVAAKPGSVKSLALRDAPGGKVLARSGGYVFEGYNGFILVDDDGDPVSIRSGNQLVSDIASDSTFVVPTITVTASKRGDKVTVSTGRAALGIEVQAQTTFAGAWAFGSTNSSGAYVADFRASGSTLDIKRGTTLSIALRLASGDIVRKNVVVE
jgi:hypothetical protein